MALTTSSARLRTGSHALTTAASTVIEKNTLSPDTVISDSAFVFGNAMPLGSVTPSRLARTVSFVNAIGISLTRCGPNSAADRALKNRDQHRPVNRSQLPQVGLRGRSSVPKGPLRANTPAKRG